MEKTFPTANLGASFVRGLQGNDQNIYRQRHVQTFRRAQRARNLHGTLIILIPTHTILWDTYLPAFKELVTKANVAGVMCAYNAINTQPCCRQ